MKIVIDRNIPFVEGVFEPYAKVVYTDSSEIGPDILSDADVLIVRSRTRCDEALLKGTGVKMISTAGIGIDHIDMGYCRKNGIFIQNASGCNSAGVMNYVCSALFGVAARKSIPLNKATIGIIGSGDSGRQVERMALSLGLKPLVCDPPRAVSERNSLFCDLDYLLRNSDIVTLHVPLTDSTRGMAGASFFSKMKLGSIFINTARGELVVDDDLLSLIHKFGAVVIDTWNGEPHINKKLMDASDIATPHIAGYTYKSKLLSTSMSVKAVARFLGISDLFNFYPSVDSDILESVRLDVRGMTQGQIASTIQYNYPIFTDDFMFRLQSDNFEQLRANYRYRREFYFD